MAKAFKKKGNPTETVPVATTIEKVGDVEYGVADYNGRKTYFEKDDNGAFSIPSQDSELNPHLFPGYNPKTGTIDNSNAVQSADVLTPSQEKKVGKAFRKEIQFNKSLAKSDQYNIGDAEMLRNDQDPNNPQYASMSFVPFANNIMPGDEAFMASMKDATFAQPNFNQEEIDQNIGNMMRQNGWSYEQAYESVYGTKPTGPVAQKFLDIQSKRQEGLTAGDQQAQINALATRWAPFSGQTIDLVMNSGEATKQITTGTPVNQTVLPTGAAFGMVNGQRQLIMPSETPYNPALNRKAWAKMDTTKTAQEKWGGNPPLTFEAQKQYYRPNAENVFMGYGATNDVRNDFRSPIIGSEDYTNIKFRNEYPKTWKSTPNITIPVAQSANQTVQSVQNTTSNQSVTESLPEDLADYTAMDWLNAGLRSNVIFGKSLYFNSNRPGKGVQMALVPLKSAAWSKGPISLSRLKYEISAGIAKPLPNIPDSYEFFENGRRYIYNSKTQEVYDANQASYKPSYKK